MDGAGYGRVFWITLKISLLTTVCCVLLGYLAAYFLASVRPRTRQLLLLCVIVPFFLSVLVRNYIWMMLLQKHRAAQPGARSARA